MLIAVWLRQCDGPSRCIVATEIPFPCTIDHNKNASNADRDCPSAVITSSSLPLSQLFLRLFNCDQWMKPFRTLLFYKTNDSSAAEYAWSEIGIFKSQRIRGMARHDKYRSVKILAIQYKHGTLKVPHEYFLMCQRYDQHYIVWNVTIDFLLHIGFLRGYSFFSRIRINCIYMKSYLYENKDCLPRSEIWLTAAEFPNHRSEFTVKLVREPNKASVKNHSLFVYHLKCYTLTVSIIDEVQRHTYCH